MKPSAKTKALLIDIVGWLYILLFVYAGASKLFDYEHFTIEIAKSPLLSAFTKVLPAAVIAIELIASILLFIPRARFYGLMVSFGLMSAFTVYIIIILNWSSFIPCSCGGILSDLSWAEHLIFNLLFLALAISAIFLYPKSLLPSFFTTTKRVLALTVSVGTLSTIAVILLYFLSEHEIHRNNAFIRRYPHNPTRLWKGFDIKYNSYYIAGGTEGILYLGNTTAPSHVLIINAEENLVSSAKITLNDADGIRLASPKLQIAGHEFYIIDAAKPVIFKGTIKNWKASRYWQGNTPFQQLEPMAHAKFVFSKISDSGSQHVVGILDVERDTAILGEEVLKSQSSDIFDTDGILRYNSSIDQVLYVYYYRNEFALSDTDLKKHTIGKTIDTISKAVVPVARENAGKIRTIATPPLIVNNYSCTSAGYLFVKSRRLGRYERGQMLNEASIIDVYDLRQHTYEFSFYLYHYNDEEVRSFEVIGDTLVGLTKHFIVFYKLDTDRFIKLK